MSEDVGAFGTRLRDCRCSAVLSQQELAERSGLSVRAISNLECGRTRWPHQDSLQRLADALELREAARAEFIGAADRRLARYLTTVTRRTPSRRGPAAYLPAAVPALAGRREQLATLSELLQQPGGTTVITAIGGTAGVGKTALALYWAHQVAREFPDGQLFVNLRGFDPAGPPMPPADAARMFLDALEVPADRLPQTVEAQLGLYRSLLAGKRMLVLLDNARDAAQVRPLLPGSPTCRVLVTSRNQLTGLVATEGARALLLDVLTDGEASQLLAERLGAGRIAADRAAAAQIIALCARLPLALCIIAARAAMRPDLDLAQVAADLAARPDLDAFADDGDPTADVRAAFSWSCQQLDAGAARAFQLAGLHPGPDMERYAAAALSGSDADQAARVLDTLARACMLQVAGHGRYSMHDLLRGYARELAASQGAAQRRAALTRLFDYYLRTAAVAMDTLFPAERHRRPQIPPPAAAVPAAAVPDLSGDVAARAWLDAERPNLVAVTVHMAENGWAHHAIQLAATLFRYLDFGAHFAEARIVFSCAYHAARHADDRAAEANALHDLGTVDLRQGRYEQAAASIGQALDLYRGTSDRTGQARTLANLGLVYLLQGRSEAAVAHFRDSLAMHRAAGDRPGQARALGNLGMADLRQGHYRPAVARFRESLALCRDIDDRDGEARALANLGEVHLRQGQYQQAASHLRAALALCRDIGDRTSEADALASLGVTDLRRGRYQQAAGHLQQALALFRETGDLPRQSLAHNCLGELLLVTGRPADARTQYAAALSLATRAGEKYEQARAHHGLASIYQHTGELRKARRHGQEAHTRYTELGAPEADQIRAELAGAGVARQPASSDATAISAAAGAGSAIDRAGMAGRRPSDS